MGNYEEIGSGEWHVDIDNEVPDLVYLAFDEVDDEGCLQFSCFLPPAEARKIGEALISRADLLE